MDAIKKFFDKKKKDAKFKLAGEGRRLKTSSSGGSNISGRHSSPSHHGPDHRYIPSHEAQRAGAAALARFETQTTKEVNWSLQAIRAQAKRELEAEKKLAEMKMSDEGGEGGGGGGSTIGSSPKEKYMDASPMLAVQGVYFHCPLIGPEVEPYDVIKAKIRDFLMSQLGEDKGVASCLMIHTCNKNKEKVNMCIETLCKYIENIISNPTEEKYRKIRQSNRAYEDRIASVEGTKQFLEAAGFEDCKLPFNEGTDRFWVYPEDKLEDLSTVESLRDTLVSAEPIKPQLDRSLRVLLPKQASTYTDLPLEFFTLSAEELKKEQQQRSEAVERSQMLMTKAMREKQELREMRKYRFTLIRVRFPDGLILQGTFAINEKFKSVVDFVREHLVNDWRPFFLSLSGGGGKITEEDQSLLELRFVPAVLFNFEWDPDVQDPNLNDRVYLEEDVLLLLQSGE